MGRDNMMQKVMGYNIPELEARMDIEGLTKALKEGNTVRERGNAAVALGRLKDKRAVESLIETLELESNYQVRGGAAKALGELGDLRAVEPLIKALFNKNEKQFAREWAASALGKLGDPKAISTLEKVTKDLDESDDIRNATNVSINDIIHHLIEEAKIKIRKAESLGIEVSKVIELLGEANRAYRKKEYTKATELAEQCKTDAEKLIDRIRRQADKAINEAKIKIQEVETLENLGIEVSKVIELLGEVNRVYRKKEYIAATELAEQCKIDAEELIGRIRKQTSKVIENIESIIKKGGVKISKATKRLEMAKKAFGSDDFVNATEYAEECKEIIKNAEPKLLVELPKLSSEIDSWNLTSIEITNDGTMKVEQGNLTLRGEINVDGTEVIGVQEDSKTNENTNLIKLPSIDAGKKRRINEIYIRPKTKPGEIPIHVICEFKDAIGRAYPPLKFVRPLLVYTPISPNLDFDVSDATNGVLRTLNDTIKEAYEDLILKKLSADDQGRKKDEDYKARYKYDILDDLKEAADAGIQEKVLLYLDIIKKSGVFNLDKVEREVDNIIGEVKTAYERGDKITTECRDLVIDLWVELKKLA